MAPQVGFEPTTNRLIPTPSGLYRLSYVMYYRLVTLEALEFPFQPNTSGPRIDWFTMDQLPWSPVLGPEGVAFIVLTQTQLDIRGLSNVDPTLGVAEDVHEKGH